MVSILPYNPIDKLSVLLLNDLFNSFEYNRELVDENILDFCSRQKEIYFITSSPTFEFEGKFYEVGSLQFSNIDTFLKYLKYNLSLGSLYCIHIIYRKIDNNSSVFYHIRGCSIKNTSHYLSDYRDTIIDTILSDF